MSKLDQAFVKAFARREQSSQPAESHPPQPSLTGLGGGKDQMHAERNATGTSETIRSATNRPDTDDPAATTTATRMAAQPATSSRRSTTARIETSMPSPAVSAATRTAFAPQSENAPRIQRRVDCFHWPEAPRAMGSLVAAGFQSLATTLQREQQAGLRVLLLTSCYRQEGRTSIALCLARALARKGDMRVVLADGDFSNPRLADELELSCEVGLEEVLTGRCSLNDSIVESIWDHLSIVPLCRPVDQIEQYCDGSQLGEVLEQLRHQYDLVVIDGAPLFTSPNLLADQPAVDAALLIANRGHTPRQSLEQAGRQLDAVDIDLLGVVENFV